MVIEERVAAPERSLQPSSVNIGFLFLPLQKTNEPAPKRKYEKKAVTGIGALLREKLENMPVPSQDALDSAAYAMGGHTPKRMISLVRVKSPEDILKDMTVYQAHDLYTHLKKMFGG